MKILLIAPASGKWRRIGQRRFFNGKTFRFSMLSLLSVAAETPSDTDIRVLDEQIEKIDWEIDADLVGITCMTALAPRAYEISDRFRRRGIPVILGGMHPTLCPEESARHADAIVVGSAEGVWAQVIEDARDRRLKPIYRTRETIDMGAIQPPPRELLNRRRYATIHAVQATRGCPNQCAFCSIGAVHQGVQHKRPVASVVAEIERIPDPFFIFVDDNLTADKSYAEALFSYLIPLKKQWVTQSTLSVAEDTALIELAAKAGCVGIFSGLETFSSRNLELMEKSFHRVEGYRSAIRRLHQYGIAVEAGIVLGFDGDGPEVFQDTLSMLTGLEVDAAQISVFTPLPGTPLFQSMRHRIFDTDWSRYDLHHAVFRPERMTSQELKSGHDWLTREFYRPRRIARRITRHAFRPNGWRTLKYVAAINAAYYGRVKSWGIRGELPGEQVFEKTLSLGRRNKPLPASYLSTL